MAIAGISLNLNGTTGSTSGTGLGQGIDVTAVVNQILAADRAPEQLWIAQGTALISQAAALSAINTNLADLVSKVNALKNSAGAITAKTVTSSQPGILTATAQTSATAGGHVVVVNNLATTSSAYTDALPAGTTLGPGNLTVQVGSGAPVSVTIGPGNNTLDTLVSYLNALPNLGVTASVINDAGGSRLSLVSKTIGQPGSLSITTQGAAGSPSYLGTGDGTISGLGGGAGSVAEVVTITATDATHFAVSGSISGAIGTATVGTAFVSGNIGFTIAAGATDFEAGDAFSVTTSPPPLGFHQTAGVNASLTVDGIPIVSTSNTVSTVIPGVTLNLASAAPLTPVQLNVAPDISGATQAINDFANSYNVLTKAINAQFTVPADGTAAPPLEADGGLRSLQSSLLSDVTYSLTGNNGLVNLASLGLDLNNDGTITVDSTQLNDVLTNKFPDFQNFFQSLDPLNNGFAYNFGTDLINLTDATQGVINLELSQNVSNQKNLNDEINDFETRLAVTQQELTVKYSQINVALEQLPLILGQITSLLATIPAVTTTTG